MFCHEKQSKDMLCTRQAHTQVAKWKCTIMISASLWSHIFLHRILYATGEVEDLEIDEILKDGHLRLFEAPPVAAPGSTPEAPAASAPAAAAPAPLAPAPQPVQ
jgi:hypothetical protein